MNSPAGRAAAPARVRKREPDAGGGPCGWMSRRPKPLCATGAPFVSRFARGQTTGPAPIAKPTWSPPTGQGVQEIPKSVQGAGACPRRLSSSASVTTPLARSPGSGVFGRDPRPGAGGCPGRTHSGPAVSTLPASKRANQRLAPIRVYLDTSQLGAQFRSVGGPVVVGQPGQRILRARHASGIAPKSSQALIAARRSGLTVSISVH